MKSARKMFLPHVFCSHCHKLDKVPTATEYSCYNVQSNLHAHKRYNMPSTRIPYQISWAQRVWVWCLLIMIIVIIVVIITIIRTC